MDTSTAQAAIETTDGSAPARRTVALALLPLQFFLAAGWLRAAAEKVIDPAWWTGGLLDGFLRDQRGVMLEVFVPFADHVVAPWSTLVAWLVVELRLVIGLCLLLGRHVRAALWAGVVLNVVFVMAGRVDPSAFYLVMEMVLLFALARPTGDRVARRRAVAWLVPAALLVPFVSTLHPAEVIEDPALMLVFLCGLAAITTMVRSVDHRRFLQVASA